MEILTFDSGLPFRRKQKKRYSKKKYVSSAKLLKSWRILPTDKCSDYIFLIDSLKGNTYFSKKNDLESTVFFYPHLSLQQKEDKRKEIANILLWNQRLRWTFKYFLNECRKRKSRSMNDSDPITLAPFENPVRIYNLQKQIFYIVTK